MLVHLDMKRTVHWFKSVLFVFDPKSVIHAVTIKIQMTRVTPQLATGNVRGDNGLIPTFKISVKGKLHDFIMASASYFPAMQPHEINGVVYIDGGYVDIVPVSMAVKRGATKLIAVELNPENPLTKRESKAHDNLTWIKSSWDLGNILVFDKENARRIMRLGYLDGRKAFGRNVGNYFAFEKESFSKDEVVNADCAAKVFGLDPLKIYSMESLNKELVEVVKGLKEKKIIDEFGTPMLTLTAAEKIMGLPKEAVEFIKDYSGLILKEEKNAIRYLLNHVL